jgi:hypothetical protein
MYSSSRPSLGRRKSGGWENRLRTLHKKSRSSSGFFIRDQLRLD